jgi:hypothetical protein
MAIDFHMVRRKQYSYQNNRVCPRLTRGSTLITHLGTFEETNHAEVRRGGRTVWLN